MLNKKIVASFFLILSFNASAEVLYTSDKDVYHLKLDKDSNLETQIHDYINNISYVCGFEPLDNEYWRAGTFSLPKQEQSLENACRSIKENGIEFTCHQHGLLMNEHRRTRGIPSFYPVTSEKLAREGTTFTGFVKCFFNKEFEKNNISTELYVVYKLDKVTEFNTMPNPRDRTQTIKIIDSAELIPNIKEMKVRREIVIID